ncbi:unnamed protein product [Medioppia subpectinata]|uniref:Uncharacterized protein n=1 Tax=Medioppia subpectinata TaxID=1979941 RepID=A0A7R9QDR3_9ACAR|nr:unnamed protein product [Medioppia subpectinata]CAG2118266.1 unnamed protein product [Medioppia subpectinata]
MLNVMLNSRSNHVLTIATGVICGLFMINVIVCQKSPECEREAKKIDIIIEDMYLFGSAQRAFPMNNKDMKEFCKINNDYQLEIKNYSEKCLETLSKRLISLMMYSISRNSGGTCRSKRRTAEFLTNGKCGNAAQRDNRKCWHKWLHELDGIKTITEYKLKVPLSCCTFYKMRSCFARTYDQKRKECTKKSADGLEKLLDVYATETLSFLCGDYRDDSDKCDKIVPKIPKTKNNDKTNSPITILISILNSVPDGSV